MKTSALALACAVFGAALVAPAGADDDVATPGITGSTVLIQPNTNRYAGVLLEHCSGKNATMRVVLPKPRVLTKTEFLAVQVAGIYTPAIRIDANGEAPEITAFEGRSTAGCLAPGTQLVLVSSPGGLLGGLLVVIGKGAIVSSP